MPLFHELPISSSLDIQFSTPLTLEYHKESSRASSHVCPLCNFLLQEVGS